MEREGRSFHVDGPKTEKAREPTERVSVGERGEVIPHRYTKNRKGARTNSGGYLRG